jgi:hypothetical protein
MAFNGRLGHGSTKQALANKLHERWLKNRSADQLLNLLVPKKPRPLKLQEEDLRVRDEDRTRR